jgi:dTDP-4-dehydrorhamnose reductase
VWRGARARLTVKIIIFGAGFLGHRLVASFPEAALLFTDITDLVALERAFAIHKPQIVINCAGKTGRPNVDWCESHPAETYASNTIGPLRLAEIAAARGAYLVHIGSGCIFYGPCPDHEGGWREEDRANPISLYSRSKYAADLLLSSLPDVCIARIRMPIDHVPGPRNLITKLAGYAQVIDVANSVTVVDDLVGALRRLIELRATGIFHVVNPGLMRHRDLLDLYRRKVDPSHAVAYIDTEALVERGLAMKARSNAHLASARMEALDIRLRPIAEALEQTMDVYARHGHAT